MIRGQGGTWCLLSRFARLGPWHEVRHAIAARGEARPHAAALSPLPACQPASRPAGLSVSGRDQRPCWSAADRDGQPYLEMQMMPMLRPTGTVSPT